MQNKFTHIKYWLDSVWNHPIWSWIIIWGSFLYCAWAWFYPRPPGVAIALMAAAVSIMTFREVSSSYKLLATIAILILLIIEITTITKDRADSDKAQAADRKQASDNYKFIAEGIKTAIANSDLVVANTKKILNGVNEIAKSKQKVIATPAETSPVVHFKLTQKRVISSDSSNPYALQVVIQSDEIIKNTKLAVTCDNDITRGEFYLNGQGVMFNVNNILSNDKKSFGFGFSYPDFAPDTPIVVTLFSKSVLNCKKLTDLRFSTP